MRTPLIALLLASATLVPAAANAQSAIERVTARADAQVQQKNATSKRITENLPSRMHVTMFFNMM